MVGCFKYPMFFPYGILHNYLYWFYACVSEAVAGMRMWELRIYAATFSYFAVIISHSDLA